MPPIASQTRNVARPSDRTMASGGPRSPTVRCNRPISNQRITAFDGERVTFQYRDYHDGNARKSMDLPAVEFLRRFLMHVVPARFTRIRYYGFLANRDRSANIEKARALIGSTRTLAPRTPAPDPLRCPQCGQGTLRTRAKIDPQRPRTWFDSS
jgi:hypothetical protein